MLCKPCKTQQHDECVDLHLMGTGRNGCACQHRTGGFSTSTLNPDGTKTEGVYGASGALGSALTKPITVEPELLEDVKVDPIAAIQAAYRKVIANDLYSEAPDVEPAARRSNRNDDSLALAEKHWGGAIASAMPSFNLSPLSPEELASDE